MAELSRVKKYEELRNKLQFSVEDDAVASQELSRFEKRLNQIDADNFSFKEKDVKENSKPSHARNVYVSEVPTLSRREKKMDLETLTQDYRTEDSNEFVNEYIREVKQYNMEQGLASSENTSMNVLNQIRSQIGNKEAKVSSKPFPSDYQKPQNTMDDTKDTSDIPFFLDDARATKSIGNTEQLSIVEPKNHLFEDANSLTKADIMAEVQNLVNGNSKQNYEPMGT
ncbi:MAG: hypothetical protein IJ875_03555, partial [Solobacterium sp.]|nr:hypothetical protein [Solobacterium sp.]